LLIVLLLIVFLESVHFDSQCGFSGIVALGTGTYLDIFSASSQARNMANTNHATVDNLAFRDCALRLTITVNLALADGR
jgi:hypothetical protein